MRDLIFRSNNRMNVLIIKNYIGLVEKRGKIDLGPVNVAAYANWHYGACILNRF